jgi:hypothetical protein
VGFIVYVFGFVAALGAFTYFCIPRGIYRTISTAVFVGLAGAAFAFAFEAAGQPKPVEIEWRNMEGSRIVGFVADEEAKTIYLWVMRGGVPVGYAQPWSERAEEMQDAWRKRRDTGEEFYISGGQSDIAEVRPEPQPPVKTPEGPAP